MRSHWTLHQGSRWQGKAQDCSGTVGKDGGLGLVFDLWETAGNPVLTPLQG